MASVNERILTALSLVAFVAVTAAITLSTVVAIDDLVTLVVDGHSGVWSSYGADNDDDDGVRVMQGALRASPGRDVAIVNLSQIAFALVLGQVLHRLNEELLRFSALASTGGMALYLGSLVLFAGRRNLVAWVITSQFLTVLFYGLALLAVVLLALVRDGDTWIPQSRERGTK